MTMAKSRGRLYKISCERCGKEFLAYDYAGGKRRRYCGRSCAGKAVTEKHKTKWARGYDRCKECGRDSLEHAGHGLCAACAYKKRYWENRGYYIQKERKRQKRLRLMVLEHYGGSPPRCKCCGESHYEFLAIDHIEGGGHRERKASGAFGKHFYRLLVKNNLPEGYQVLCHNCNNAKGFYGYCPHNASKITQSTIRHRN